MPDTIIQGDTTRAFWTGHGTVCLLLGYQGARLIITSDGCDRPAFERDYNVDQRWMAERDFETLYYAIRGAA